MHYQTNKELKELQKVELQMLDDIVRVCEKNKIEYFLIDGTALGLKKYNGFVPWDDDIDIGMTRNNYNKFLKLAPSQLSSKYFLQTPDSEPNSPFPFAKVRKYDTLFLEWGCRNLKINNGIYVDIFPYDKIPDNELLRRKQFIQAKFWCNLYAIKQINSLYHPIHSTEDRFKSIAKKIVTRFLKIIPKRLILKNIDRVFNAYSRKHTGSLACLYYPKYMIDFMNKETLYPLKKGIFEGKEYYVPNDLDTYLKTHYGNYWKLPPKGKRVGHKPYKIKLGDWSANS